MFWCRARPSSPTAYVTASLLLWLTAGCGRIGVEVLPFDLDDADASDARATEPFSRSDAEVSPLADARAEPSRDAEVELAMDGGTLEDDAATARDAEQAVADGGPRDAGDAASGDASDAAANRDAAIAGDASGPRDAGSDAAVVVDAGLPPVPAGLRILVDNPAGSATLRDYPVRVLLNTQTLIAQGQLASDCSNLRVYGGDRCSAARAFFLPAHTCNTSATELWLRVPELLADAREVFSITFGTSGQASNGSQVFPFFDGFDGSSLDRTRWTPHGGGTLSVSGGILQSQNIMLLESVPKAVTAGNSTVGIRWAVTGLNDTDVELGAGNVIDDSTIWSYGRDWDGVSFLSHETSGYGFNGALGSACNDLALGATSAKLSDQPWADYPPATATFFTADFGYSNQSGSARAFLRTSRGRSFNFTAPANCALPTSLSVLITLDHLNEAGSPTQRIDYVYVRPTVASEPTTSVQTNSSYACGTEP